jgi:hypothetical protein
VFGKGHVHAEEEPKDKDKDKYKESYLCGWKIRHKYLSVSGAVVKENGMPEKVYLKSKIKRLKVLLVLDNAPGIRRTLVSHTRKSKLSICPKAPTHSCGCSTRGNS